jgi:hypothetical protein
MRTCEYKTMDYYNFLDEFDTYNEWNQLQKKQKKDDLITFGASPDKLVFDDRVNSPSHYTSGKTEVIDVIEDAVKDAPSSIYGMLQGQVLKYMLRVWLKDNPLEDLKKAQWYLTRLIEHYENPPGEENFPPSRFS